MRLFGFDAIIENTDVHRMPRHPKQIRPIQAAPLRELYSAPMYGTFTPFVLLAPAPPTSTHADREQIVTQIFPSALEADFALHSTAELAFPPIIDECVRFAISDSYGRGC